MFRFSQEHEMVRGIVRKWAESKLAPKVDAFEAGEPPYELMRDLANTFGLPGMVRAAFDKMEQRAKQGSGEGSDKEPKLSAMGAPALSAILSIELSRVCPGFMLAFGASMGLAGGAIAGK